MYAIVQGGVTGNASNPFVVRLKTDPVTMDPFDLTSIYDIQTCFHNADGTELMVGKVSGGITIVGNPLLGKILIALTAAQTALLAVSDPTTLELAIVPTLGADPVKVSIPLAYSVVQSDC